jgi:hypothetical protein
MITKKKNRPMLNLVWIDVFMIYRLYLTEKTTAFNGGKN